jgi:hypothetical protein
MCMKSPAGGRRATIAWGGHVDSIQSLIAYQLGAISKQDRFEFSAASAIDVGRMVVDEHAVGGRDTKLRRHVPIDSRLGLG